MTIVRKEFNFFLRNWKQALLPPMINITLYYIIFGHLMATSILSSHPGVSYIQFILPGLVVMSLIMSSFSHTVSSFYAAKTQKTIEEILVTPTPYWVIIAGFSTGGMIRGLVTGGSILLIASYFVDMHFTHTLYMLIFAILTTILFSLIGLINALLAENTGSLSIFSNFFITPLTYLGGIFYSISILPEIWQKLSHLNPVFYMVDGFRYGVYGIMNVDSRLSMLVLVILNIIFFGVVWYMFSRGKGLRIESFHN
ncbi:ABC transporter permease [Candidatus Gracilibacteria bacterium]|nr:ABC transporter permease [Candidatus Gracilibacteria bacterium]